MLNEGMLNAIEGLEELYDPENDTGKVTAIDMRLLSLIKQLVARVDALEETEKQRKQAELREFVAARYRG